MFKLLSITSTAAEQDIADPLGAELFSNKESEIVNC